MHTKRLTTRLTSLTVLTALALAGLAVPAPVSARGGQEKSLIPLEERRQETDSLVIYSYDSLPGTLRRAIVTHFAEEYGVEVDLQRLGDTGAVYTQLFLERDAPRADAVIGLDSTFLPRLHRDRLLEPYKPENLEQIPRDLLIDPEHYLIPYDFGYISLNYDTESPLARPGSWEDLLDSRFARQIIMLNPATSSPGRNFLLLTVAEFGDDEAGIAGQNSSFPGDYRDFWKALRPNILTVTGGWSDGYGLYTQGEAPLVVSYETSPAYHRHFEETRRYESVLLDGGAYLQIEAAGIVRGAPNRLNAERLLEFLLSLPFQELIPLSQIMYPVHPEAELPRAFTAGDPVERPLFLENHLIEAHFDRWLETWEDVLR